MDDRTAGADQPIPGQTVFHRLDMIEALLFELLRLALPPESRATIARRLTIAAPAYSEAEIIASMERAGSGHQDMKDDLVQEISEYRGVAS